MFPMRPTILLVEKDTLTREMYQRELATEYSVISCADAKEAREVIRLNQVDALIIEPAGLGSEGWTFLKEIKENKWSSNPPILMCTVLDAYDTSLKSQFSACLIKPVLPANLLLAVQEILQTNHA